MLLGSCDVDEERDSSIVAAAMSWQKYAEVVVLEVGKTGKR